MSAAVQVFKGKQQETGSWCQSATI